MQLYIPVHLPLNSILMKMAIMHSFQNVIFTSILLLYFLAHYSNAASEGGQIISTFNRTSFPSDFIFGAGASAYQTEGSPLKYGRGPSNWDEFTRKYPEKIADGSTGEVTTDFYNKYKQDIKLAKRMGLDSFRLSISWSRVIPSGMIKNGVNSVGVQFYKDVINEILSNGIIPFVTLFHFDTPQALEDAYGGPLSSNFINDFEDYANFCFNTYGDKVKYWTTINEPNILTRFGYASSNLAPGRCSLVDGNCTAGDSATEPYLVAHHLLLAHATAATLYKTTYQASQKGEIGMNLAASWFYPLNETSSSDKLAVSRALDFDFGRILHPLTYGDYPKNVKMLVGKRLPIFTKLQSKMLKGSQDFLTLNYYTSYFVYDVPPSNGNLSFNTDGRFAETGFRNGVAIGSQTAAPQFFVYPKGLYRVLMYVKDSYKNPRIYITENGCATSGSLSFKEAINDAKRVSFMKGHLKYLRKAIRGGCNVKGYHVWAFTDNWEWSSGFSVRFGLIHIDFGTLKRYFKASALWYKKFLLKK